LDSSVVFGYDANVMLDHAFAEVLPTLDGFGVSGLVGLGVKDVGVAEARSVAFGDHWPTHELMYGKTLEKLGLVRDFGDPRVSEDTV
jgi:hypothetical protein